MCAKLGFEGLAVDGFVIHYQNAQGIALGGNAKGWHFFFRRFCAPFGCGGSSLCIGQCSNLCLVRGNAVFDNGVEWYSNFVFAHLLVAYRQGKGKRCALPQH